MPGLRARPVSERVTFTIGMYCYDLPYRMLLARKSIVIDSCDNCIWLAESDMKNLLLRSPGSPGLLTRNTCQILPKSHKSVETAFDHATRNGRVIATFDLETSRQMYSGVGIQILEISLGDHFREAAMVLEVFVVCISQRNVLLQGISVFGA